MRSRDSLGRKVSREIKRAMFERTQSMDFDSMMLSEIRQRKTNTTRYCLYVESE